MKHTPGPWKYDDTRLYYNGDYIRGNGVLVCQITAQVTNKPGEREANAALIAACPDLYSALKNLVSFIDPRPDDEQLGTAYVMAKKALARADGRE